MKLALMQPYLFPYIGYWQLIHAVDTFVLYDDAQWIQQGWINRNHILVAGMAHRFTLSIKKLHHTDKINTAEISAKGETKYGILTKIQRAYTKSPFYKEIMPLIESIILNPENMLSTYIHNSIEKIATYLEIPTTIKVASLMEKNDGLKGQDRVLDICTSMGTHVYINAIGGRDLYNNNDFKKAGVDLYFLQSQDIYYQQYKSPFVPNLSIIDQLMFCGKEATKEFLKAYTLIK